MCMYMHMQADIHLDMPSDASCSNAELESSKTICASRHGIT